jgi:hypothetical protein
MFTCRSCTFALYSGIKLSLVVFDSPSGPPCARCQRGSIQCHFPTTEQRLPKIQNAELQRKLESLRYQNTKQRTELDSLRYQNAKQQTELYSLRHQNAEQQTELKGHCLTNELGFGC